MRARATRALVAAGLVGVLLVAAGGSARAQDTSVSGSEAAALARDAITSDEALAELRQVERVGGQAVDLGGPTAGLGPGELGRGEGTRRARLEALAVALEALDDGGAPSTRADAKRARDDARDVVTGPDYREKELPRPFRGPLRWLGDRLETLFAPVERAYDGLVRVFGPFGWTVKYLLVAAVAALVAVIVSRRSRARVADHRSAALLVDPGADPDELRRRAEAALAAGDHREALRLFFAEGVLRLARQGRLDLRPDTTASRVAQQVGGPEIERLVRSFEEVVYGGAVATRDDVERARSDWTGLLSVKAGR